MRPRVHRNWKSLHLPAWELHGDSTLQEEVERRLSVAEQYVRLPQQNPYGLVLLHSAAIKTMTLGFPTPLLYKRSLNLRVTVNEPGVVQILGNVVHGGA